jgi:hypothetical protein
LGRFGSLLIWRFGGSLLLWRFGLNDLLLFFFFFHDIAFSCFLFLLAFLGVFRLLFRRVDGRFAGLLLSFNGSWRLLSFIDDRALLLDLFFRFRFFLRFELRIRMNIFVQFRILLLNVLLLAQQFFLKSFILLLLFLSLTFQLPQIVVFTPFEIFSFLS